MDELVAGVHDALNNTALPRRPDPATLPDLADGPEPVTRALPQPRRPQGALEEVLVGRRSRYSFAREQPDLADLASLLVYGIGTAPRAGGLPSVVPHLVVCGPGALERGVHRVDLRLPVRGLTAVRAGDPTAYLAASLDQPQFADRAPVWAALVVDLGMTLRSYPARHYRTVHLDAGAAMQNLLLVAASLGLAACPVMGYDDAAWARLLDLSDGEALAGVVPLGCRPRPGEGTAPRPSI